MPGGEPGIAVCQKTPGLIRALMFNPALTTCASERMKTQRFSYFAGFAARERMREAKPVKLKKVAFSHFFDTLGLFVCRLFLQKILQHSFRVVEELLCDYIMLGVFVIGTLYALVAQLVYLRPGIRHKYWRMSADDEL